MAGKICYSFKFIYNQYTQMKHAIEKFVRHTLGCNCSKEVFEQINIIDKPEQFDGLFTNILIEIGGRLLLLVVIVDDALTLQDSLAGYFDKGRHYRDEKGFNRFRLLIACKNKETASRILMHYFNSLEQIDERLHLHVLSTDELPSLDS